MSKTDTKKKKPTFRERIEKTKALAHKRVVERGIVELHFDPEIMELLLQVSHHKRIPGGIMCKEWIVERLKKEAKAPKKTA